MELIVVVLIAGGLAGVFGYLTGASSLRKGDPLRGHGLMWGSIAVLIALGLIQHDWAPFLLFVAFILVGQAATEMWRLRKAKARGRR
jgi:hypothetical protein